VDHESYGTGDRIAVTVAVTVPRIIIKTGRAGPDGREEELTEYICDAPGCPNVAIHVLGGVRELGLFTAVCQEHVPPKPKRRSISIVP
jgi:hypothetical protein